MIPYDFLGAANATPINIHDMLPSDTRFKILVFVGDISVEETMDRARALAEHMDAPEGFLKRFGQGEHEKVFDVLGICATKQEKMDFTGKSCSTSVIFSCSHVFCSQTCRSSSGRTGRSERVLSYCHGSGRTRTDKTTQGLARRQGVVRALWRGRIRSIRYRPSGRRDRRSSPRRICGDGRAVRALGRCHAVLRSIHAGAAVHLRRMRWRAP